MIVYAYYGFGKTTLCANNKYSPFIEIDEEFGQIEATHKIKELSKHAILLVNGHIGLDENDDIVIDIAFLPRNVNIAVNRLQQRGVDASFLTYMIETYNDVLQAITKKAKIVVFYEENEYLINHAYALMHGQQLLEKYNENNTETRYLS